MKKLATFFTVACIGLFIIGEIHTPWALVVFMCGLIARRAFNNWFDDFSTKVEPRVGWLYRHATAWADGLHKRLDPRKCKECKFT